MALYRGCTKVSGIGQSFNPENTGTEGQVLTKTNSGYAYCDSQGGGGQYVDVFIVGGGGGGGSGTCYYNSYSPLLGGGGGGAGGVVIRERLATNASECIVIGAGGAGATTYVSDVEGCPGCNGGNSMFGNIVAYGGGGGGAPCHVVCGDTFDFIMGKAGGSGGGAGNGQNFCCGCMKVLGGDTINMQGHRGGGNKEAAPTAGGGGGAGGDGEDGWRECCSCESANKYGAGGNGIKSCFSGILDCYAGGGSGGFRKTNTYYTYVPQYSVDGGGLGGYDTHHGCPGTKYGAGGGGGGRSCHCGGCGCQGIVIVRYPTDGSYGITSSTGGDTCRTCTIDGVEYCIHEFTSDGTFCITG